jgi:glycosyltransferase involved in cell wall biosynthesis
MEFPLVSIIVPMYNTAGCIARCVKSICAQTYKSIEILLLNDGSTDDTLAVCRALAASDHRIALVDKTNTGAADTRNQGIALAHGKYIQFVDSDDWLAPDFTEKLVSAAEAHTADLVIAPFWMVYPENYVEHIRPWEKALQHVLQRNPPRTRAYGYLPAGVYTGQEYAKHLIQKPNTFYYGSPNSTAVTSCGSTASISAKNCLRRISCSTPNICAMCAPPFPSRTSAITTCRTARASPTPE